MVKILLSVFLLVTFASGAYAIEGSIRPPEVWRLAQIPAGTDCINLEGTYSIWGGNAPGTPLNFRGVPFSLDFMLGMDLPNQDRHNIIHVVVEQRNKSEVNVAFFTSAGLLVQKKASQDRVLTCKADRVIIEKRNVKTVGEAASGHADITEILFRGDDDSLIVFVAIEEIKTSIFSSKKRIGRTEQYWAKFKALKP